MDSSTGWNWKELESIPDMPNTLHLMLDGLTGPTQLHVLKPCCGVCGDSLMWKVLGVDPIVDTYDIESGYIDAVKAH